MAFDFSAGSPVSAAPAAPAAPALNGAGGYQYGTLATPKPAGFVGPVDPQHVATATNQMIGSNAAPGAFSFNGGAPSAAPAAPTPSAPAAPKQGLVSKVVNGIGNFLGIEDAGQGTSEAVRNMTGANNQTGDQAGAQAALTSKLITAANQQQDPAVKAHVMGFLKQTLGQPTTTEGDADPGANLSDKQVLGSFGNVALDATLGGELSGAGALPEAASTAGKLAQKVGVGAAQGYGFDVANNAQQNAKGASLFRPGLGTAVGASVPLIGAAIGKAAAPFSGSYNRPLDEAAAARGVKLPVSAVTDSTPVKYGEAAAAKTLFGSPVQDTINTAASTLKDQTQKIVETLRSPDLGSAESQGKDLQAGIKGYETNFRAAQSKVYDQFMGKFSEAPAVTDKTVSALQKIVDTQSKDVFSKPDSSFANMLNRMDPNTVPAGTSFKDFNLNGEAGTGSRGLTFENLKNTRTAVGAALAKDPQDGNLKQLYGAISDDMDKTVSKVDPSGGAALQKLSSDFKSGIQKVQSNVVQSITKSSPERVLGNLTSKNSADSLNALKGVVGDDGFQAVTKSFLNDQLDKATAKDGSLNVTKLRANLGKYDPETLQAMMNPEQQKALSSALDELDTNKGLQDALKSGTKPGSGSQTAFLQKYVGLPARATLLAQAVGSGNWGEALGVLGETGGEYGLSKLYSTDIGRQYLTKGFDLSGAASKIPSAGKLAGAAVRVANSGGSSGGQ